MTWHNALSAFLVRPVASGGAPILSVDDTRRYQPFMCPWIEGSRVQEGRWAFPSTSLRPRSPHQGALCRDRVGDSAMFGWEGPRSMLDLKQDGRRHCKWLTKESNSVVLEDVLKMQVVSTMRDLFSKHPNLMIWPKHSVRLLVNSTFSTSLSPVAVQ